MTSKTVTFIKATCIATVVVSSVAFGQISLLQPTDSIIAIDLDEPIVEGPADANRIQCGEPLAAGDPDPFFVGFNVCSPGAEEAWLAFDGTDSKYLNFGRENSGLIVTPVNGPVAVQSFLLQAANDAPGRDPMSWELYGTNDTITDTHHGTGLADNWTLIASGDDAGINEDPGRNQFGTAQSFENPTAYSSYKMQFPTVRDSVGLASRELAEVGGNNSMQVAEIEFYSDLGASVSATRNGPPLFGAEPQANVLAFWNPVPRDDFKVPDPDGTVIPSSSSPGAEGPEFAIDGSVDSKYLNFGKDNSGVIVTLSGGAATLSGVRFTTANDAIERDPVNFEIHGTNETITTGNHGQGIEENWTLVSSGETGLAGLERLVEGPTVAVGATLAYDSYRITFPNTFDDDGFGLEVIANSMQVAEIELFGEFGGELGGGGGDLVCDLDSDGDCDQADIDMLYAAGTDPAGIDTWLSQASSTDNTYKADAADTYILGDANLDGDVNSTDLGLLLNNFNKSGDGAATWNGGDLNASGGVDSGDLGLLLNNFGSTSASSAAAVPEPSAISLLFLAAISMLGLRRRS